MGRVVQLPVRPRGDMEAKRHASIEALRTRDREAFDAWYQEHCDRFYWTRGQCCAGCDHWMSDGGMSGECSAAQIVSGIDVLRSMGIEAASFVPPPGHPYTKADFHCGKFKDDFDWSSLDHDYLEKIGATLLGKLKQPPCQPIARAR